MVDKYYRIFKLDPQYAVAKSSKETLPGFFPKKGLIEDWKTPIFEVSINSGKLSDYSCSDIGGRLCSPRLKQIIEEYNSEHDLIQWLPVEIYDESSKRFFHYHHLHFPTPFAEFSRKHSKFDKDGDLINPCWEFSQICKKDIFNCSEGYERIITVISEKLKNGIEKAGCTGLNLQPAAVVYNDQKSQIV